MPVTKQRTLDYTEHERGTNVGRFQHLPVRLAIIASLPGHALP